MLHLEPKSGGAYSERGQTRSVMGDYIGALADLNEASLNPTAETYYHRGCVHFILGNYSQALEDTTQTLRLNPNFASAYLYRGLTRYESGDEQGGFADFQTAAQIKPDDCEPKTSGLKYAYYIRGWALYRQGQHQAAVADFYKALKLDPRFSDAYATRGLARFHLGNETAALEDLNRAIDLNPNADRFHDRGTIHYIIGNYDNAIADFDEALRLRPQFTAAYYNRGNAHYELGDASNANLDYHQAMEMESIRPPIWELSDYFGRALARLRLNNRTGAIADLQKSAKISYEMNSSQLHQRIVGLLNIIQQ